MCDRVSLSLHSSFARLFVCWVFFIFLYPLIPFQFSSFCLYNNNNNALENFYGKFPVDFHFIKMDENSIFFIEIKEALAFHRSPMAFSQVHNYFLMNCKREFINKNETHDQIALGFEHFSFYFSK